MASSNKLEDLNQVISEKEDGWNAPINLHHVSDAEKVDSTFKESSLGRMIDDYIGDKFSTAYLEAIDLTMPPSVLPENFELRYKQAEEPAEQDYQGKEDKKLSSAQLNSIYMKGEFQVESEIPEFPNTWKVNRLIIHGLTSNWNYFKDILGVGYYVVYNLKYLFMVKKSFFDLISPFKQMVVGMTNMLSCLIGLGLPNYNEENEDYNNLIERRLVGAFKVKHPNFPESLFTDEVLSKLNSHEADFKQIWSQEELILEQELYDKNLEESQIAAELLVKRSKGFIEFIKEGDSLSPDEFEAFSELFMGLTQYLIAQEEFEFQMKVKEDQIRRKIAEEDSILSRINFYKNKQTEEKLNIVKYSLQQERNLKMREHLRSAKFGAQMYEIFLCMTDSFEKIKERFVRKRKIRQKSDSVVLKSRRMTPHKAIEKKIGGKSVYKLNKNRKMEQATDFPGWRLILIGKRYISFSLHLFFLSFDWLLDGMFGVRSLFQAEIVYVSECDRNNGSLTYKKKNTIGTVIRKVKSNIKKSREKFESKPDTGLCSKAVIRIFNIFWNYVIKAFLLGIFIVIFYSILIAICSILSLVLLLVSVLIALPAAIAVWIGSWLFYDYDKSGKPCPLLSAVVLNILIKGVGQLVLAVLQVVLSPVVSLLIWVLAMVYLLLRTVYDTVMMGILYTMARKPKSDSMVAWKISGPGTAERIYKQIDFETACLVLIGKLEELKLENFRATKEKEIEAPFLENNSRLNRFFNQYNLDYNGASEAKERINEKKEEVAVRVATRVCVLPSVEDVRFNGIELSKLQNWASTYLTDVCKGKEFTFLWEKFNTPQGAYRRLVEQLMKHSFGEDVFFTLDDENCRLKVDRESNSELNDVLSILMKVESEDKVAPTKEARIKRNLKECSIARLYNVNYPFFLNFNVLTKNIDEIEDIENEPTDREEVMDSSFGALTFGKEGINLV